jgi:hypothetical protein
MERGDAEDFTQALGQIVGGSWRQIALAKRLGVPQALGYDSLAAWVQERIGGYINLAEDEKAAAVLELRKDGESFRSIEEITGARSRQLGYCAGNRQSRALLHEGARWPCPGMGRQGVDEPALCEERH